MTPIIRVSHFVYIEFFLMVSSLRGEDGMKIVNFFCDSVYIY